MLTTNNSDIESDNEQNDGNGNHQEHEHDKDDYVGIIWRRFKLKHSNWEYVNTNCYHERMIQTIEAKSIDRNTTSRSSVWMWNILIVEWDVNDKIESINDFEVEIQLPDSFFSQNIYIVTFTIGIEFVCFWSLFLEKGRLKEIFTNLIIIME